MPYMSHGLMAPHLLLIGAQLVIRLAVLLLCNALLLCATEAKAPAVQVEHERGTAKRGMHTWQRASKERS